MRPRRSPLATAATFRGARAVLVALLAAACDRPPSADSLKEWTQADHHSNDDDKGTEGSQVAPAAQATKGGRNRAARRPHLAAAVHELPRAAGPRRRPDGADGPGPRSVARRLAGEGDRRRDGRRSSRTVAIGCRASTFPTPCSAGWSPASGRSRARGRETVAHCSRCRQRERWPRRRAGSRKRAKTGGAG